MTIIPLQEYYEFLSRVFSLRATKDHVFLALFFKVVFFTFRHMNIFSEDSQVKDYCVHTHIYNFEHAGEK